MSRTSVIVPYLIQGVAPPLGGVLARLGYKTLILCAEEFQPDARELGGLEVIHAPNDDRERLPSERELALAIFAGKIAADRARQKKLVLVTCMMGRNRSGLVSGIALHFLTGRSGEECARFVQKQRPGALTNPHFVRTLRERFPAREEARMSP
jgi:protein-tyrosine phosphatase